jgi:hypothetical protein
MCTNKHPYARVVGIQITWMSSMTEVGHERKSQQRLNRVGLSGTLGRARFDQILRRSGYWWTACCFLLEWWSYEPFLPPSSGMNGQLAHGTFRTGRDMWVP